MVDELIEVFREIFICLSPFKENAIPFDFPSKELPFQRIG
jgi:hypothetical protein